MRALEMSTGKTSAELDKMMKEGKLTAEYIKPLIDAIGQLAEANGAYEKALLKLGTVENRMKASAGLAAQKIADAGFTEGLINLYQTLMDSMSDNEKTLQRLGKVYEKIFNGIAYVVKGATVFLVSFVRSLETVWKTIQWGIDNPIAGMIAALPVLIAGFRTLGTVLMAAFSGPLAIILGVVAAIDEIRAYFDEDVRGLFDDKNWTKEQSKKEHAKRRIMFGMGTPEDFATVSAAERTNSIASKFGNDIGDNSLKYTNAGKPWWHQFAGISLGFSETVAGRTMDAWRNNTLGGAISSLNQTIIVQGNMSEDNVTQIRDETKKVMEQVNVLNMSLGGR